MNRLGALQHIHLELEELNAKRETGGYCQTES